MSGGTDDGGDGTAQNRYRDYCPRSLRRRFPLRIAMLYGLGETSPLSGVRPPGNLDDLLRNLVPTRRCHSDQAEPLELAQRDTVRVRAFSKFLIVVARSSFRSPVLL